MTRIRRCMIFLGFFAILLLNTLVSVYAYDEYAGIEYDDVVDVGFVSYRNGEFVIEYTAEGAFRVEVNTNAVNFNFVNAILGMKEFEKKPYVTWNVGPDLIEYYNVTIYDIVVDSTPPTSPVWKAFRTVIIVVAVLGGAVGAVYLGVKFKGRMVLKGCSTCKNTGTSKCAKCGKHYCSDCSSKGCTNCGSRQFIRLKN
ncbi:MAG: hypothetical protein GOP50_02750 [Candidatus Heimdallarchaeota archaeon]|nr:hypothetical protein [Candidatus Heimdallarchaeota archaeon]